MAAKKHTDPSHTPLERLEELRAHTSLHVDGVTPVQSGPILELLDIFKQHIAITEAKIEALEKALAKAAGYGVNSTKDIG